MFIENKAMRVEISEHGAEAVSIYDKENSRECLWNANPKYWKRSSPVLFPNVGKLYGGHMRTESGAYPLSQHGFARDMDFKLIESDATHAVFCLTAGKETFEKYPYDFSLTISYTLNEKEIIVGWKVENRGEGAMPFTIGGHPAFVFSEGGKSDHYIEIPERENFDYLILNPEFGCAGSDSETLDLECGFFRLGEEMFARDALIIDNAHFDEIWLCDRNKKRMIGISAPDMPNFGIWSVADAPFVCLEPWQGRCDDVGFTGLFSEKKGAVTLKQGSSFETSYKIMLG